MGKFTAHRDPAIDRTVEAHLARIVAAIRRYLEPQAIILHGSFGRGEGSVMRQGRQLRFFSDYEIAVVTPSPWYRGRFAALSRQLTEELGVEVSIAWMRPGRLRTNQPQNLSLGRAAPTIHMYEIKAGGQTIYGPDLLRQGEILDPRRIPPRAGIRLLFNRLIEALPYFPAADPDPPPDPGETIRWLNKLILACAESLLLLWGEYHFSYAERGRRFSALSARYLATLPPGAAGLPALVERATEFKLRPAWDLYPADDEALWPPVLAAADAVFRHLMAQELEITFDTYAEFPAQFLHHPHVQAAYNLYRLPPLPAPLDQKLVNAIKYLRRHRLPPRGYWTHPLVTANLVVFALIPLLALGWSAEEAALTTTNAEARRWLTLIGLRRPPRSDPQAEWQALYRDLRDAWVNFCYN